MHQIIFDKRSRQTERKYCRRESVVSVDNCFTHYPKQSWKHIKKFGLKGKMVRFSECQTW